MNVRPLTGRHFLLASLALFALIIQIGTSRAQRADAWISDQSPSPSVVNCSDIPGKIDEITAVTSTKEWVEVDCNLNLDPKHQSITKQIRISGSAASGITIDCNGAKIDGRPGNHNGLKMDTIQIRSVKSGGVWNRPERITIRDCQVFGRIHMTGMDQNFSEFKASSWLFNHVSTVRTTSPRHVTLENMTITGLGRIPVYVGPGVTYFSLLNSEIKGVAEMAIYLDAESGYNSIIDNYIHVDTDDREQMAIDASSQNRVLNNRFSGLEHGGIFLYRNCGQCSASRHTTPNNNTIVNNFFYYDSYTGPMPAVWIGARNRNRSNIEPNRYIPPGYCDDDDDESNFGSGVSDLDYARYNVVMQNRINKRSVNSMILQGHSGLQSNRNDTDTPNYVGYNTTTHYSAVPSSIGREAGCFVGDGYLDDFLLDGQVMRLFRAGANGAPTCRSYQAYCNNGVKSYQPSTCEAVETVRSECQVTGNNAGCVMARSCSSGDRIIGIATACNLESGTVTSTQLNAVPTNYARVVRPSDKLSDGRCWVRYTSLNYGTKAITGVLGSSSVTFGCSERDSNGGDCHAKTVQYCQ